MRKNGPSIRTAVRWTVGLTHRKKIPVAGGQTARCLRGNARGYQAMGDSSTKQFPHFLVLMVPAIFCFSPKTRDILFVDCSHRIYILNINLHTNI